MERNDPSMPNGTDKTTVFTAAILENARTRADALRTSAESAERAELDAFEAEQRADGERRVAVGTADAKAREDKRVTAAVLKCRRELLQYREDCAFDVFGEVRARLSAYPATPAYGDTLRDLLGRAVGALPGGGEVTVYLRPEDMSYAGELRRALPNSSLAFAEGSFALGGLIAESGERRLRADLTFDSALEDLSGRFSELTGFDMEDRHGD